MLFKQEIFKWVKWTQMRRPRACKYKHIRLQTHTNTHMPFADVCVCVCVCTNLLFIEINNMVLAYIIQWPMFVRSFLFFIRIIVAFQRLAVWNSYDCVALARLPACIFAQTKMVFWSAIRSFVRSFNVPLIALMLFLLACMHAIFMKRPTGKLYFHFELELLQYSRRSYSPAHIVCFALPHPPCETLFQCIVRLTDKVLKLFGFA